MASYDRRAIGRRIKSRRKKLRLSQEEVVTHLPIEVRAYQSYENGETQIPVDNLITICQILDTTPDYILGFQPESSTIRQELMAEMLGRMGRMNDLELVKLNAVLRIYGSSDISEVNTSPFLTCQGRLSNQ